MDSYANLNNNLDQQEKYTLDPNHYCNIIDYSVFDSYRKCLKAQSEKDCSEMIRVACMVLSNVENDRIKISRK